MTDRIWVTRLDDGHLFLAWFFLGRPTGKGRTRRPSKVSSLLTKRSLPNGRPRVRPQPDLGPFGLCQAIRQLPPEKRRSLTLDNGREFARPTALEKKLEVPIYFAHPYHAWERGTNENANGLLRQYPPKSTDLSQVTNAQLQSPVRQLNQRPRKCLGFQTPLEVFHPRPPG